MVTIFSVWVCEIDSLAKGRALKRYVKTNSARRPLSARLVPALVSEPTSISFLTQNILTGLFHVRVSHLPRTASATIIVGLEVHLASL